MKYYKELAVMVALILALLFAGCAATFGSENSLKSSSPSVITKNPSAAAIAANPSTPLSTDNPAVAAHTPSGFKAEFEFEEYTFIDNTLSIQYPQIVNLSDNALQDKLNKIISDSALRDLPSIQDESTLDEYRIVSEVTYSSPELISINFEGYCAFKQAAHPSQFLYAVTIDVQNLKTITLKDLVNIDEKFVHTIISGPYSTMMGYEMTSDIIASIADYFNGFGVDFWIKELENADIRGSDTVSYLRKDALAISVAAPHVMGDHIEILTPYANLQRFKTDSPIWNYLV